MFVFRVRVLCVRSQKQPVVPPPPPPQVLDLVCDYEPGNQCLGWQETCDTSRYDLFGRRCDVKLPCHKGCSETIRQHGGGWCQCKGWPANASSPGYYESSSNHAQPWVRHNCGDIFRKDFNCNDKCAEYARSTGRVRSRWLGWLPRGFVRRT